jgi:ABC-2 type transport system permease protein
VKAYLSILRLRFAVQLQYRAAAAASLFTNFFFGFVRIMVFMAFYASSTQSQPLSLGQTITYMWLVQATFRMLPYIADREMMNLVRTGGIAYELSRPINLYAAWYCRLLALRIVPTLLTGLPVFILALALPEPYGMALPASPADGAAFAASLLGSLLLGCAITNIVTISALWTAVGDGMELLLGAAVILLSGGLVPLAFFPDWAEPILRLLPFSGLVDVPFRFYVEAVPPSQLVPWLTLQLSWTFIAVLTGLWLLRAATRRVTIQGG